MFRVLTTDNILKKILKFNLKITSDELKGMDDWKKKLSVKKKKYGTSRVIKDPSVIIDYF